MSEPTTPRSRVQNLIRGKKVDKKIQKQLLFGEALKGQLKFLMDKQKDLHSKRIISRIIHGQFMKKYKLLGQSRKFISSFRTKKSLSEELNKHVPKVKSQSTVRPQKECSIIRRK